MKGRKETDLWGGAGWTESEKKKKEEKKKELNRKKKRVGWLVVL